MLRGRDSVMLAVQRSAGGGESCLVTGPVGSGRTAILDELMRDFDGRALRVRGKESVTGAPFAPLGPVLAEFGADLSDTLRLYTEFPPSLVDRVDLVVVDDADRLDRGSAVFLAQVHRAGVPVVAAGTTLGDLPDGLRETAQVWTRLELTPLDPADLYALAEDRLGGPLLAPCARRLVSCASGLPAVATEILAEAARTGHVEPTPAGLRLDELPVSRAALLAAGVDETALAAHRDTVETLATCGAVPENLLDAEEVTLLARLGVVRADGEQVCLVSDLWRAWALHGQSLELRRRTMLRTAERLRALPDWDQHRGVLEACARHRGDLAGATRWLLEQGRIGEAAHLMAEMVTEAHDDRFGLHLLRADVALELGDIDGAVTALDEAEEHLGAGDRIHLLVERWITALGGRASQEDALAERVTRVVGNVRDPQVRDVVLAVWRRRRAIVGGRREGVLLEPTREDAVVVALRESMTGSLDSSPAESILTGQGAEDEGDLDEQFRVLAHFLTLVYDGRLVEGRAIAEHHHQLATREARPTLGLWTYNLAKIAFHAGQYDASARYAAEARRHLAWRDVAGQALPAEAMLAAALARLGRGEQARRVCDGLSEEDRELPRVRIGVARVEAEELRRAGRSDDAAAVLAAAGEYAVAHDEAHSGLLAVDEAFLLRPDDAIVELLVSLRDKSALVAAFADRAVAMRDRDPRALVEVAARFEAMIQPGRAAHAWRAAAQVFGEQRAPEAARRAQRDAVRVSSRWQVTPWPAADPDDVVLTPREYDIAVRAARRVRSREIAEELALSVRTVDNHLARTYRKLGIAGRDELAEALELADGGAVS